MIEVILKSNNSETNKMTVTSYAIKVWLKLPPIPWLNKLKEESKSKFILIIISIKHNRSNTNK